MGNETSGFICLNQECEALVDVPFLPVGVALLLLVYFPMLIHVIKGGKNFRDVVSISETWRLPMIYTMQWTIVIPMIVFYNICLRGVAILLMFWTGVLLIMLVATVNPEPPPEKATEQVKKTIGRLRVVHAALAMLLFSYMLGTGLALVATTFINTGKFKIALFMIVFLCLIYTALLFSAIDWCSKTSLYEILFCTIFTILLAMVDQARVVTGPDPMNAC